MSLLRRLDERLVPAIGQLLRGTGRAASAGAEAAGRPGRMLARGVRRFGVSIAAVILVAAAALLITLTGGDERSPVRPNPSSVVPPLSGQRLGPVAGSSVSSYLNAAKGRFQQLDALPASQPVTAIVDLTGYLTPQAVTASLLRPGLRIRDAFARVPTVANAAIHTLAVASARDLASSLSAARAAAQAVVKQYRGELAAESRRPSSTLESQISAAAGLAAQAGVDARGLGPTCGCVFALVVSGPVGQLSSLAASSDVRVLDPAPPATPLSQLMVVPLEPQVTGTVPQVQFAGE